MHLSRSGIPAPNLRPWRLRQQRAAPFLAACASTDLRAGSGRQGPEGAQ